MEAISKLDGQFSLVLHDARDDSFVIARDPIGITRLKIRGVRACVRAAR